MRFFPLVSLALVCCGRAGFEPQQDPRLEQDLVDAAILDPVIDDGAVADRTVPVSCSGFFEFQESSEAEPNGEYSYLVEVSQVDCAFEFTLRGAGGGATSESRPGGAGGQNIFDFIPHQTGVLRIIVGGGGTLAPANHGGPGGGASSVLFVPDDDPGYTLAIAGGGGGGGLAGDPGGTGGGDGPAGGGVEGTAPGDGTGGTTAGANGGTCGDPCLGGPGGGSNGDFGLVQGGTGKGAGAGASYTFGGGGGGGYGGGGAPRYGRPGGGGAGKVFTVPSPASLINSTNAATNGTGEGSSGGVHGEVDGTDGSATMKIH